MAKTIRTAQARMAQVQDRLKRKLLDNLISLEGSPTDCIRIKCIKNDEGDLLSRVTEKADVVSIIFPPMKDVPYSRLDKNKDGTFKIESLTAAAGDSGDSHNTQQQYQIIAPFTNDLAKGDLIIRIMIDPTLRKPIIFVLQVLQPLGTFGGTMLIYSKFNTSLYNEPLKQTTLDVIVEMAKRRLYLKF